MRLYKASWFVFAPLAIVISLFLAAKADHHYWWFWLPIALAILVGLWITLEPSPAEIAKRIRKYPTLLMQITDLEESRNDMALERDYAEEMLKAARDDGIVEGRAQIRGEQLASELAPPTVLSISPLEGSVALVGTAGDPVIPLGARYFVRTMVTDELRGIVEVAAYDEEHTLVYLRCVELTTPEFWQFLLDRVLLDPRPPQGIHLEPYHEQINSVTPRPIRETQEMQPEAQR